MAGLEVKMLGPVLGDLKNARRRKERLLEFINNCQHAPYPEGRSCDFDGGIPTQAGADDFDSKGKPKPGSDAWLIAHNISREVFLDRPYHRFEEGDTFDGLPPEIQSMYEGEPEAVTQLNKIMAQSSGYIMARKSAPGSPEKGIVPQTRPDNKIATNQGQVVYRQRIVESTQKRLDQMKELDEKSVLELQESRVERAKTRIEEAKVVTKDIFLQPARTRLEDAKTALAAVKDSGDQIAIDEAKRGVNGAKNALKTLEKNADFAFGANGEKTELYREVMTRNAEKTLRNAEGKLERYKGDPSGAMENEVKNATQALKDAQAQLDGAKVKYVFPPNPSRLSSEIDKGTVMGKAGRVNAHMDENIRRLVNGKGRVYLAMEGNIKEDSLLSAVTDEMDPDSAVISVPSVTLWRNKDMMAIAQAHLRGREVVLIPDADGVNNPRVQNEARAMQSLLESVGAKVVFAPPPIPLAGGQPIPDPADPKKVLMFEAPIKGSPTGVIEPLKGVDDYLGVGKGSRALGTLGNLMVWERSVPPIDIVNSVESMMDVRARPNAEAALIAMSNLLGPTGSGRVGTRMLSASIGKFYDHGMYGKRALEYLEADGHIKVERIYDENELTRGRRVMHPDMTEARIEELVHTHVIDRPSFGDEDTQPVDFGYEETPIITIQRKYRATDSPPRPLSSLESSQTPKMLSKSRVKGLRSGGKTLEEIADILGVSESTVSAILKK